MSPSLTRCPSSALSHPFFGGGFPAKIDYSKRLVPLVPYFSRQLGVLFGLLKKVEGDPWFRLGFLFSMSWGNPSRVFLETATNVRRVLTLGAFHVSAPIREAPFNQGGGPSPAQPPDGESEGAQAGEMGDGGREGGRGWAVNQATGQDMVVGKHEFSFLLIVV